MRPIIFKVNGESYFLGIYSNSYVDREGEILSQESHTNYKQWIEETGFAPQITIMHAPKIPDRIWYTAFLLHESGSLSTEEFNEFTKTVFKGFSIGEVLQVEVFGRFALVLGKIYPEQEPIVNKLLNNEYSLGMSHGFIVLEIDDRIISKYRSFEFTILPDEWAANVLTQPTFYGDFVMGKELSSARRNWLRQILGEEYEKMAEENLIQASEILDRIIPFKEMEESSDVEEVAEETPAEEVANDSVEETPSEEEVPDVPFQAVYTRVYKALNIEELAEVLESYGQAINSLTEKIAVIEKQQGKSEDEKIAEAFTARSWRQYMPQAFTKEEESDQELVERLKQKREGKVEEKETSDTPSVLQVGFWQHRGIE